MAQPSHLHLPRAALAKVPRQQRSIAMVHSIMDAAKRVLEREGLDTRPWRRRRRPRSKRPTAS